VITKEIEFLAPESVAEALEVLSVRGPDVTVLSGGMSLMPMMNLGIVKPSVVMSLNHVAGLDSLSVEDGELKIGGMTRHRTVMTDDLIGTHAPMLAEAARTVGDVQVRNRGTIGGSIAHADPSADYLPVLAAGNAELVLASSEGTRRVPAAEFFIDLMFTVREPHELLTEVVMPVLEPGAGSGYVRFARVEGSFAIVNAAAVIGEGYSSTHIALGGVSPAPVMLDASDLFADGLSDEALEELASRAFDASEEATGDIHSDADYRRNMAGVFARRAVELAAGRLATAGGGS
jgi:CO/xanthine dehydrogenase FAD-binding subunit